MSLLDRLREGRSAVLRRWKELILETQSEESARFIRGEKDRFNNPVGHTLDRSLPRILDVLIEGRPAETAAEPLDGLVRLRAVQDLSASAAVGFVFFLKTAIAGELGGALREAGHEERRRLEAAIDGMALAAFDVYVHCREQVWQIRANDLRRRTSHLWELLERHETPVTGPPEGAEGPVKGGSGA
jgi:hypothetical protein